jgi:hypothetical protein
VPDDAAWADHVVVPDDARELAGDIEAYQRELKAARRARRWGWLTGSRAWKRWSFPLGMLAGALTLAALVFALLAVESSPRHHGLLPSTPLATPTAAPGQRDGLLPDAALASGPTGSGGEVRSAVTLRPALVALVPVTCHCTDILAALADQAHNVGVTLDVVAPLAADAEVSALPGQVRGVRSYFDATGALATAYGADGVTVLVVDPDGVVSFIQRQTTVSLARTLPVQGMLLLPPSLGGS